MKKNHWFTCGPHSFFLHLATLKKTVETKKPAPVETSTQAPVNTEKIRTSQSYHKYIRYIRLKTGAKKVDVGIKKE